jgi:hypothetical protein
MRHWRKLKPFTRLRLKRNQAKADLANAIIAFRDARDAGIAGELPALECLDRSGAAAERALDAAVRCVELGAWVPFAGAFVREFIAVAKVLPDDAQFVFTVDGGLTLQ